MSEARTWKALRRSSRAGHEGRRGWRRPPLPRASLNAQAGRKRSQYEMLLAAAFRADSDGRRKVEAQDDAGPVRVCLAEPLAHLRKCEVTFVEVGKVDAETKTDQLKSAPTFGSGEVPAMAVSSKLRPGECQAMETQGRTRRAASVCGAISVAERRSSHVVPVATAG